MTWIAANEPVSAFDYNGNGRNDLADVAPVAVVRSTCSPRSAVAAPVIPGITKDLIHPFPADSIP